MTIKIENMETAFPGTTKLEKNEPLSHDDDNHGVRKTDWRSIYIANIIALLSAIQLGSIIPTIWPYLKLVSFLLPNFKYFSYFFVLA